MNEALDLFGEGHFGEVWTGDELSARTGAFGPPQPPLEPESGEREDLRPDNKIVRYVVDGIVRSIEFERALELFEIEKEELHALWQEETAAFRRYIDALRIFRQVLHAGHIKPSIQTKYGSTKPVPRQTWASNEALLVFKSGRTSFAVGDSYFTVTVEGIVLVPLSELEAYFRSKTEQDQEQSSSDKNTVPPEKSRSVVEPALGGRPIKWDWEACWLEMCQILHNEGLPETQAEMVRRLQDWFIGLQDNAPVESEIKKRVSKLFRAIREAEN